MKLKMLLLVGAIAPALAICQPAFAAERPSDIVVAQQQPSVNANKKAQEDKKKKGDKKAEAEDKRVQQSKHDQNPAAKQKQDHKSGQANKGGQRSAQQQKGNEPAAARKDSGKHKDERNQGLKANAQQQQEKADQKQDHNKAGQAKKGGKQSTQQQKGNKPAAANKDGGKRKDEPTQNQKANAQQQQEKAERKQDNNKRDNNKGGQPTAQQQKSQPAADKKGGQHADGQRGDNKQASKDRRLDKVRSERKETHEGNRTVIREQNRTIIRENGRVFIRHDDSNRFEHGARNVREERRGNERVIVIERPGGTQIINVWDADGRLLRRSRRDHGGREVVLFDNHPRGPRNNFNFIVQLPPPIVHIPRDRYIVDADRADRVLIYDTLIAPPVMQIARPYTLDEVRYSYTLRERMPRIDLDTINFETGSWDVTPGEARRLAPIAEAMRRAIQRNPDEIFLIEGHTDAVGSPVDNLSLSDRRAEAVAEVLTDEFGIPPENLVTQGYGEQHLKVLTPGPDRRNRRVTVRRITPLLRGRG